MGAFIQTGGGGPAEERATEVASDTGRSRGRGIGEGGGTLWLHEVVWLGIHSTNVGCRLSVRGAAGC